MSAAPSTPSRSVRGRRGGRPLTVRVRRGALPLDPSVIGRTGTVADTSEYRAQSYGVILDDEVEIRYFAPDELEVIEERALPPDRLAAKQRRALP